MVVGEVGVAQHQAAVLGQLAVGPVLVNVHAVAHHVGGQAQKAHVARAQGVEEHHLGPVVVQAARAAAGHRDVAEVHPAEPEEVLALGDLLARAEEAGRAFGVGDAAGHAHPGVELGVALGVAGLLRALRAPWGAILLTGPTGCGKTTALYACLNHLATPERKLMSVEDPVEFLLPGVVQVAVRPQAGVTFATAVRAFLRSAPNVIMLGEVRDLESLQLVHQAALTGHLVLTTLHADEAARALVRMVEIGSDPFLVADSTCAKCHQTGFRGREVIAEALEVTPEIGAALRRGASLDELRTIAVGQSMTTLAADGLRRAAEGHTSIEEVLRVL